MLSVVPPARRPRSPEELIASAPELEALPVVAQRILAMVRDERASIDAIANVLGSDQALASAVLRHANSGRAMLNRRIASVREAVARIGQRELADVLLHACTGPMLDRGLPPYALPRRVAWRHAATVSVGARQLAEIARNGASPDEASTAGLLHDVGKVVFSSVLPELTARAVSVARARSVPVWQAEREVLGFDHGEVGAALLRSWGFPETVSEAVRFHHQPAAASSGLATIIYLADAAACVVGAVGGGGACVQPAWDRAAAAAIGASAEQADIFLRTLQCVEETELVRLS